MVCQNNYLLNGLVEYQNKKMIYYWMSDKTRSDVLVYRLHMIEITRVISTYSPATEEERMVNGSLSM